MSAATPTVDSAAAAATRAGGRAARKQRPPPTAALTFNVASHALPAASSTSTSTSASSPSVSLPSLSSSQLPPASSPPSHLSSTSPVSPSHARQMLSLSVLSALPALSSSLLSPAQSRTVLSLSASPSLSVDSPHLTAMREEQSEQTSPSAASAQFSATAASHRHTLAASPSSGRRFSTSVVPSSGGSGSGSAAAGLLFPMTVSSVGSSGGSVGLSISPVPPARCRSCNCKNSKCLKLYCECFAAGQYCDECNCKHCHNNIQHEAERKQAIEVTLERNPRAFRPKIAVTATASPKHATSTSSAVHSASKGESGRAMAGAGDDASLVLDDALPGYYDSVTAVRQVHHKGCHCKKSFCLKKYCEVDPAAPTHSACTATRTLIRHPLLSLIASTVFPSRHRVFGELQSQLPFSRTAAVDAWHVGPLPVIDHESPCKDCKNHSGSVERLALESKGQLPPSSPAYLPPSVLPPSVTSGLPNGLNTLPLAQSPSSASSMAASSGGSVLGQSSGVQPHLATDVVHELTRSLLLAASRHCMDDSAAQSIDRRGPDALALSSSSTVSVSVPGSVSVSVSGDNSSSQAVHDLLLLASPLAASGHHTTNSFSFLPPTGQSGNSSSGVQHNKRKRGESPSPSISSRSAPSSSGADDSGEKRKRQIRRDALAEVHKARQLAASHAASNQLGNATATPHRSTSSADSIGNALLCAEDAMDESESAASNISSTSDIASASGSSLHSLPSLSTNTSPATSPAPSDDSHSPSAASSNHNTHTHLHSQHNDDDAALAVQSHSHSPPLAGPSTNGQYTALEEFSLFLKKMLAVQHRSQHYTRAAPHTTPTALTLDSARQQQAEA